MKDLFAKCERYTTAKEVMAAGIYPYFHALSTQQDTEVIMDGHPVIMLGSNNYLGLTSDERVKEAAAAAVRKYGSGCSGSRFLNGTLDIHLALEKELAEFLHKDDCVAFSTGFQSNLAIISCITDRNDLILSDSLNHASLIDGTRLSPAKTLKYRHNDMADLKRLLETNADKTVGGILIVTDGVFSMEGEICKLPEIVELARQYGARILLDDAHGLGVLGPCGRGTAEHFGLENEVDLIMNTFSKSLASLGGCVVGSELALHFIRHNARPFIFSASIPPAQVAATREALAILKQEPWRVSRLHEITRTMRGLLARHKHIQVHDSGNDLVPIIPLLIGQMEHTLAVSMRLLHAGVYVNPVMPPAVAANACLLRTSYTAEHTNEQLQRAADIFAKVLAE